MCISVVRVGRVAIMGLRGIVGRGEGGVLMGCLRREWGGGKGGGGAWEGGRKGGEGARERGMG